MPLFSIEASPIYIGTLGYLLYFIFLKSATFRTTFSKLITPSKSSLYWIQLTRIVAFICMAYLPIAYIQYFEIDFWTIDFTWTSLDTKYTLILVALLVPMGAINSKGKGHLAMYPQVRMLQWNPIEYISNIFSWGIYLLGYEFLFRGILFLGLIPFVGLYAAIIINTVLYALAHLYKGKNETVGSIPLGIVLCIITAQTETIWTAFGVHWIMATNNFVWSQYYTHSNELRDKS